MSLGLIGALAAALCYGVATVLQGVSAARTESAPGVDATLLLRLVRQGPYVVGLALDLAGFGFSVLALRTLPLFLVQSVLAAAIAVTAVGSVLVTKVGLRARELLLLAAVAVGLVLLGLSAAPERAVALSFAGQLLVLAGALPVGLLLVGLSRSPGPRAGAGLAAVSGLAYGGVSIAARALVVPDPWWRLVIQALPIALVVYGLLGVQAFAAALQRLGATGVAAVSTTVQTLLPAAVGLALLGDRARSGWVPVAAVGFALAVAAALGLSRFADVGATPMAVSSSSRSGPTPRG